MQRNALCCLLLVACTAGLRAQQYVVDTLAQSPATSFPVAIAFTPDGSGTFFFTEKATGRIRIFTENQLRADAFATVSVTSSGEQGLLGVAVHPQYPDSPFVYAFYTRNGDRANLVVRFRDSSGVGVSETPIVVVPRVNSATNHNGGNVHFGPDGKLYATFGENASTANSQDTSALNLRGKIVRLNSDGSIPADNPFPGKPFWSYGHRNSFDFTFDALTGKMYCSENGPSCNDEVNRVPRGGNMGWPVDGNCTYSGSPLYVRPLYYFPGPLPAVTGICVYRSHGFPRLRGNILFTGNSTPTLWTLRLTANGDTIVPGSFSTFFQYGTGFADVEVGPNGDIFLANGPYSANRILRLRPIAPVFASAPPQNATEDVPYVYTPTFTGTLPEVIIDQGPAGMAIDTTTWTVRWTPGQGQTGTQQVSLRARNGAGEATQAFAINVATGVTDGIVSGEFHLEQNYPNPFNPMTNVGFRMKNEGMVSLKVFDVLGREVATLVNQRMDSGRHTIQFDATQLAAGVYLYRLATDGFSATKFMVLLK